MTHAQCTTRRGPIYRVDTRDLKSRIGRRWLELFEEVADELYEARRHHGDHVPCPMHGGKDGFRLFSDADLTGGGICNTCGGFNDGIALLMKLKGWSFLETVEVIEEWLDRQGEVSHHEWSAPPLRSETTPPAPSPWALAYINRTLDAALWDHHRLSHYYCHRGLGVPPSPYLGFIPRARYQDDIEDDYFPMMAGFFQAPGGEVVCVHRTYLDPYGDGKADVDCPKKFSSALYRGALNGAAIRLRDPWNGTIGLAEGIETAEAVFQATGIPTWACGCANGLEHFIPPAGITHVAIWADRDRHGKGQQAGALLARRLLELGLVVKLVVPSSVDEDWLDQLLAHGEGRLRIAGRRSPLFNPHRPGFTLPSVEGLLEVVS